MLLLSLHLYLLIFENTLSYSPLFFPSSFLSPLPSPDDSRTRALAQTWATLTWNTRCAEEDEEVVEGGRQWNFQYKPLHEPRSPLFSSRSDVITTTSFNGNLKYIIQCRRHQPELDVKTPRKNPKNQQTWTKQSLNNMSKFTKTIFSAHTSAPK